MKKGLKLVVLMLFVLFFTGIGSVSAANLDHATEYSQIKKMIGGN